MLTVPAQYWSSRTLVSLFVVSSISVTFFASCFRSIWLFGYLVILGFAVVSSFSKTALILSLTLGLLKVAVLYISSPLSLIQRSIRLTFLASSVSYSGPIKISSHFYLNCLNILWRSPGLIKSHLWRFVCHSHTLFFVKYKEQVLFIDTRIQYHNKCVVMYDFVT